MAATAMAQSPEAGHTDIFNELGMGAYSLSYGQAYAGDMPDSVASPLNPAALGQYLDFSVHFFDAIMDSSKLYFLQGSYRAGRFGSGSLSWSMWQDAPQLVRTDTNGFDNNGNYKIDSVRFSNSDHLFMWSHGLELPGGFSAGVNLKYIRRTQADYTGQGLGVDIGVLQKDWIQNLSWGLVFQDLGKARIFYPGGHQDYFDQVIRLGVEYQVIKNQLECALDAAHALSLDTGLTTTFYLGVQYSPMPMFSIRAGLHHVEYYKGQLYYYPAIGIGIKLGRFIINYAFWSAPDSTGFSNPHRVSIIYRIPVEKWFKTE